MTKNELWEITIEPVAKDVYCQVKQNWDRHSKPIDGFGDFEDAICRIAAAQGRVDLQIQKRAAVIMIADNGIVEEGVSQSSKEITYSVAKNLGEGISTVSTLGKGAKVDILPVDIGMDNDQSIPGVRNCRVRKGTRNFLKSPAMMEEEALQAISYGIELVKESKSNGYDILATGEMGIGNTTTSTAVLCAMLDLDPMEVTGRGAGLSDQGLSRKQEVIQQGLERYGQCFAQCKDEKERAWQVLCCLGGLDIAGLVGLYIGGALYHVPIAMDGLISSVAAFLAENLCPGVKSYMLASHRGRECGTAKVLEALGLPYYMQGNMALGEGTGAVLLFPLLDTIFYYYRNGSSFQKTKIQAYTRFDT